MGRKRKTEETYLTYEEALAQLHGCAIPQGIDKCNVKRKPSLSDNLPLKRNYGAADKTDKLDL